MNDVLVGRVVECVRISEALERAVDQRPSVVLVVGEAGLGKTTLLRETVRRADERGFVVALGAAVPGASGLAFAPVRAALRSLPDAFGAERIAELVAAHPGIEGFVPTGDGQPQTADPETGELYVRLLSAITELTDERPMLLALEDLHWADRSTLELLSFLVRNLSGERLAVVVTVRADDPDVDPYNVQAVAELSRLQGVERIDLDRLDVAELRALVQAVRGSLPDDGEVVELLRRSEGNPFFAVELLTTGGAGEMPPSIREVVDLRLGNLADRHRQLLRAASVIGPTVDPQLVAAYVEQPETEVEDALRAAIDADVLVVDPVDGVLRFRHALLQERAYGQLLAGERRRLHDRLASTLAEARTTPPAVLAFHLERAHRVDDALVATLAAAREAAGDHGTVDAVHHYLRVVDLWRRAERPEEIIGHTLVDVLEEGVQCAMNVGIVESGHELVEVLVEELDPSRDPIRWVRHAASLVEMLWEAGRTDDARSLLQRAHEVLPEGASPASVRLHERMSYAALSVGDYGAAAEAAEEAAAFAEELEVVELRAVALNRLGLVHCSQGRRQGLEELRRSLDLARTQGPGHEAARAAINYLLILHLAGDLERASEAARELLDDLDEIAIGPLDRTMVELIAARIDIARGRFEPAEDRLTATIVPAAHRYREYRVATESELAVAIGDFGWAQRAIASVEQSDDLIPLLQRSIVQAELSLRTGRAADAVRLVDEHLSLAVLVPDISLMRLCALGIEAAPAGDPVADRYRSMAEAKHPELAAHELMPASYLDGLLGDVRNLHDATTRTAPTVGRAAADGFEASGHLLRAGWARLHHARALVESGGDRAEVEIELVRAHAWASDAGAVPLRTAVEELARRSRVEIPGVERLARDDLGLTGRETEVLRLVASGRTNREIAGELFISPKTASVHVSNILRKVGARNRGEAAAVAHRHGLDLVS